jgi:uncharacterized membrane protein
MKQIEFLNALKEALTKHGVQNVNNILSDYQEHFVHGLQNGQSEEEISSKLGNPVALAKAYETEALIAKVKNPNSNFQWETAFRVIGRLIVLAPFNVLVLFIPGILIFVFLVAGWSVAVALVSVAFAIAASTVKIGFGGFTMWLFLALGAGSLAALGLAIVFALLMFLITKQIILALISYLQWNLKFALEK